MLLIFSTLSTAQTIRITGDWNFSIPSSDIKEAGEDFSGSYESNLNQVYIDVESNKTWTVLVQKNNIDWNNDLRIYVKRSGDGIGSKKVTGGKNYRRIRNKSNNFFKGDKDRLFIPLQYKVDRVSVTIPANTYIVEIVYTLQAK